MLLAEHGKGLAQQSEMEEEKSAAGDDSAFQSLERDFQEVSLWLFGLI